MGRVGKGDEGVSPSVRRSYQGIVRRPKCAHDLWWSAQTRQQRFQAGGGTGSVSVHRTALASTDINPSTIIPHSRGTHVAAVVDGARLGGLVLRLCAHAHDAAHGATGGAGGLGEGGGWRVGCEDEWMPFSAGRWAEHTAARRHRRARSQGQPGIRCGAAPARSCTGCRLRCMLAKDALSLKRVIDFHPP